MSSLRELLTDKARNPAWSSRGKDYLLNIAAPYRVPPDARVSDVKRSHDFSIHLKEFGLTRAQIAAVSKALGMVEYIQGHEVDVTVAEILSLDPHQMAGIETVAGHPGYRTFEIINKVLAVTTRENSR